MRTLLHRKLLGGSHRLSSTASRPADDAATLKAAHLKRLALINRRARSLKRIAITGASSNTGRYLSEILVSANPDLHVVNLTNNPNRTWQFANEAAAGTESSSDPAAPPSEKKTLAPLDFDDAAALRGALRGAELLVATYWQRFDVGTALRRLKILVDAAHSAGVPRIVYVSHTKPSLSSSDIPYIQAKAEAEAYVREKYQEKGSSGIARSFGFVRPCCIFSDSPVESVVVNNMAYIVRRAPVTLLSLGGERQHFQPVHVRDIAEMCAEMATRPGEGDLGFLDAVGPEKLSVAEFLRLLARHSVPRAAGLWPRLPRAVVPALPEAVAEAIVPGVFNRLLRDTWVHSTEMRILHQDLACSALDSDPVLNLVADGEGAACYGKDQQYWGVRALSSWVESHGDALGAKYINTLQRYYGGESVELTGPG